MTSVVTTNLDILTCACRHLLPKMWRAPISVFLFTFTFPLINRGVGRKKVLLVDRFPET